VKTHIYITVTITHSSVQLVIVLVKLHLLLEHASIKTLLKTEFFFHAQMCKRICSVAVNLCKCTKWSCTFYYVAINNFQL